MQLKKKTNKHFQDYWSFQTKQNKNKYTHTPTDTNLTSTKNVDVWLPMNFFFHPANPRNRHIPVEIKIKKIYFERNVIYPPMPCWAVYK